MSSYENAPSSSVTLPTQSNHNPSSGSALVSQGSGMSQKSLDFDEIMQASQQPLATTLGQSIDTSHAPGATGTGTGTGTSINAINTSTVATSHLDFDTVMATDPSSALPLQRDTSNHHSSPDSTHANGNGTGNQKEQSVVDGHKENSQSRHNACRKPAEVGDNESRNSSNNSTASGATTSSATSDKSGSVTTGRSTRKRPGSATQEPPPAQRSIRRTRTSTQGKPVSSQSSIASGGSGKTGSGMDALEFSFDEKSLPFHNTASFDYLNDLSHR